MNRNHRLFVWLALLLLALAIVPAAAQDNGDDVPLVNPNANISFPPPVYVLRGAVDLRGSANLPNMTNYFVEFRQLNDDLTSNEEGIWSPALLASARAVQDDVLGSWDTANTMDGLYELRLTVNVTAPGQPVFFVVSPVRIENEPPPFVQVVPTTTPLATQAVFPVPTTAVPPTAAPTEDLTPRIVMDVARGNVRSGDSTLYPIVAGLSAGQTAVILGISSRGTGWFLIDLGNERTGWVSGEIVDTTGSLVNLPRIVPPPVPVTPTPTFTLTPIATITPALAPNLVAGNVYIEPGSPVCNEEFNVGLDVANLGNQATLQTTILNIRDLRAADGSEQISVNAEIPIIQPGQTVRIDVRIRVGTWFNESHRLVYTIDPGSLIVEASKTDNTATAEYFLNQGGCG
ncbi:MAG: hypothetical protein GYB67_00385 [Chloroflexi bacterium]|nr:hypothetical protein [Chloroflexota bacterium]